jgi:hypothetical protein
MKVSRIDPFLCFIAGTMSNSERVRWLSQVCEVMTDPSAEAFLPTVMTVHSSRRSRSGFDAVSPPAFGVCAVPAAGKRSDRAKSAEANSPAAGFLDAAAYAAVPGL